MYNAPSSSYGASSNGYGAQQHGGPVRKDFYVEHERLKALSDADAEEYRREHHITIGGRDTQGRYKPIRSFNECSIPADLMVVCSDFEKPTPIQAQTWPIALSGRDMIGIAETGSGKTLSFTLPGVVHIRHQAPVARGQGPIMLVLSPTRELAMQTEEVCQAVGAPIGLRTVCLYGGVGKNIQRPLLAQGVHIAIATPGRLLDLVREGRCRLDRVSYLVLDEADRMLDMGFEPDIRAIIGHIPRERQTVMFSATWPPEIQRIASDFLQNPVKINIGHPDLSANRKIRQIIEVLPDPDMRDHRLHALLQQYHASGQNRILIFTTQKRDAARVDRMLRQRFGWKSQSIHGDLEQPERTRVIKSFRDGSCPLLVATDVAARGLDIPDVEYVINYQFPVNIEDYVHRIGRTGRGGKEGVAHSFFLPDDRSRARDLMDILRKANQQIPPQLEEMAAMPRSSGRGRGGGGRGGGGYGGGGYRGPDSYGASSYGAAGAGGGYGGASAGGYSGPPKPPAPAAANPYASAYPPPAAGGYKQPAITRTAPTHILLRHMAMAILRTRRQRRTALVLLLLRLLLHRLQLLVVSRNKKRQSLFEGMC